ncbi:MAG TPA: hypothetical protein VNO51_20860 [Ilumatobacteraceae bacterium]|nr:hypothetical protein [Ilumatobacteraceae bacterium]
MDLHRSERVGEGRRADELHTSVDAVGETASNLLGDVAIVDQRVIDAVFSQQVEPVTPSRCLTPNAKRDVRSRQRANLSARSSEVGRATLPRRSTI